MQLVLEFTAGLLDGMRDGALSLARAALSGAKAAVWGLAWAVGFCVVVGALTFGIGLAADATGITEALRGPSDGERVAECRELPGFPNYDRNMRFVGCEAQ